MILTNTYKDRIGREFTYEYHDADSFDDLPTDSCTQCYGVCFYEGKMVIGFGGNKKSWGLIGGTIEPGETFEETLRREIKEESNMEILSFRPIGYQKVLNLNVYQLRFVCKVKPHGPFVVDGGEGMVERGVTEIKLIDPKDYKEYFDWGTIGDRIIGRAVELLPEL